jgi:hypothetical protein
MSSHRARSFARRHQFCGRRPDGEIRGFFQYRQTWHPFSVYRDRLFIGSSRLAAPSQGRLGRNDNDSSGIVVFLAYEGFERIANASERIKNPRWTHPIGYYDSILAAIVVYVLAIIVAIGHMPFEAMKEAQSFALSATAQRFMVSFGFGLMALGAFWRRPLQSGRFFLGRRSCLSCSPSTEKCHLVLRASLRANTSRACCSSESLRCLLSIF